MTWTERERGDAAAAAVLLVLREIRARLADPDPQPPTGCQRRAQAARR